MEYFMKSEKIRNAAQKIRVVAADRKVLMAAFMLFMIIAPTFAAGGGETIEQLDTWGDKILSLLQSTWVKVLLLVALIIEAIGVVVAGQQGGGGQILKKFAPWIIGTLILLCASGICSYFLGDLSFEISMSEKIVPALGSCLKLGVV